MPVLSGSVIINKAVFISGSLVMGSGAIYLLYQIYTFSKQMKRLTCQVTILSDKVYRAETDLLELRRQLEQQLNASDDADDEFVLAPEEERSEDISLLNGSIPNSVHKEKDEKKHSKKGKDMDSILHEVDDICKDQDVNFEELKYCLKQLNDLKKLHPSESRIFWRLSETKYLMSRDDMLPLDQPEQRHKELMTEAREAAQKAVNLDPKSGNAHRWAAIILGSVTQFLPISEQIKSAFIIKNHIATAIKYKPDDPLLYHMLGRWCYSVYMLSWVERKLASALYATPPTATLEEAMENFQKSESLDPLSSMSNQLYLAKGFIAKGDYRTAVDYLKAGEELKIKTSDDKLSQEEIQKLLNQYGSYAR